MIYKVLINSEISMRLCIIYILLVMACIPLQSQKKWQHIPADHKAIHYTGRFDDSNSKAIRYDWPGTTIQFQFTGNDMQLLLEGGERNYFNLFIDEILHAVVHLPADTVYTVNGIKGKGSHHIKIQKRTEGEMGTTIFKGINIGVGQQLLVSDFSSQRRIEFIGNSITCGYGTEGASREEDFLPSTENVNKSYAFITARAFDAECVVVAHSGLGVIRNYGDKDKVSAKLPTMPDRYVRTLDEDSLLNWDFNKWQPHAVVINLGTNDYWGHPYPDKAVFQHRYENFIREVRSLYDNIPIFCVCGPLRDEPAYSNIKEVIESSRLIHNDQNLYFVGIPTYLLNKDDDLGSDWHPSYRGQRKMAAHLIPILANILHWDYNDSELRNLDSDFNIQKTK